jgi:hypothetical protein
MLTHTIATTLQWRTDRTHWRDYGDTVFTFPEAYRPLADTFEDWHEAAAALVADRYRRYAAQTWGTLDQLPIDEWACTVGLDVRIVADTGGDLIETHTLDVFDVLDHADELAAEMAGAL